MKQQHFYREGEAIQSRSLHYKECGLDNIFLLNGFIEEEYEGERFVSIADSDGLKKAIGMHIVLHRKAPSGKEIRFIRNELDMSQADLAELLGVSGQSVARWEKSECEAPGPAILSLRVVYILHIADAETKEILLQNMLDNVKHLLEADETDDFACFSFENDKWLDGERIAA